MPVFKIKGSDGSYFIPQAESLTGYEGKTIVVLGDSIQHNYGKQLTTSLVIEDELNAKVVNAGLGGTMASYHPNAEWKKLSLVNLVDSIVNNDFSLQLGVTASGLEMGAQQHQAYINQINKLKDTNWLAVDGVIISYGTNDWANSNLLLNNDDSFDKSTYLGALRYAIRALRLKYPHLHILVCQPIFRSTNDRSQNADNWRNKNGQGERLVEWASALNMLLNKDSYVPIAQTFTDLGINADNERYYFSETDGTHPNERGIMLLGRKMAKEYARHY